MEANDFVTKLKADGSANDICDLDKVYASYKELLRKLPAKDKGPFSLNVLCILCRNIDKVPSWRDRIDGKDLLSLSIDCVRETRGLQQTERVKTLACVYHLHKFVVRQSSQLPPELVLKLSYMPFECDADNLLKEYVKTYWNLLADRFTYIEKLKSARRAIIKLLPKLTEDIQKVIQIYDSVQFCDTILVFLFKKLHFLYNMEYAKDLNDAFGMIIESLSQKKDVKSFKKLTEKEILELYVKFSDCFYVVTENATKLDFKDSVLSKAVRCCISFIGHAPEMFQCLQTFYLNTFCCVLTNNHNTSFNDTVLNTLIISCETTEKLGYKKAIRATYPYVNQLLRVYIEYNIAKGYFTEETREICLKLIIYLIDKLENTEQLLKCDNCKIKSGLHDALRLSFLAKNFVSSSLKSNLDVTIILEPYHKIIEKQHRILTDLCRLGCSNYEKCLRKLQTDIHNTAILLNKAQHFDSAIKLFDLYLTHEFLHFKTDQDFKNVSRALYNKSICELDTKLYEKSLLDAFLSLVFAQPDGLSSEKYMSLVMDIKAKALKGTDDEGLQMLTVLDACYTSVDQRLYGNLKPFFGHLDFSTLLQHEYTMYARLWPSLAPVAGVWAALRDLCHGKRREWLCAQPHALATLYHVILRTPTAVRSIHHPHFAAILDCLLSMPCSDDVTERVTRATLLLLKSELNMADAAVEHGWKTKDQNIDPDLVPCCRTLRNEHEAMRPALRAVELWTDALTHIDEVSPDFLIAPLLVLRVSLQQLLHVRSAHALQLAHVALRVSRRIEDRVAYMEAVGVLLSHAVRAPAALRCALALACEWAGRALHSQQAEQLQPALVLLCDAAIFYNNTKQPATSAKLLRIVQAHLLSHGDLDSMPFAVGRLLDAQQADLSVTVTAQRHYLTVTLSETSWCTRHRRSLQLKQLALSASLRACTLSRRLRLPRRARAVAACALGAASARCRLALCAAAVDTGRSDVARQTIDDRLKHILGLKTNEHVPRKVPEEPKTLFTPQSKLIETMRDAQTLRRNQTSPSLTIDYVEGYKQPEFYDHDVNCLCYACETPSSFILASQLLGLEASVYFRAKEIDIAKNYFEGVLGSFGVVEDKLKTSVKKLVKFERYVVELIEKMYERELLSVELEVLIEAAYFELSLKNYSKSDDYIYVRINEILQVADVDGYVRNEIMNLMTASEVLRKADKITDRVEDIENDFESLKLTPAKEILKTPEAKPAKPPVYDKIVVKKEELPDLKCKVPVLNFDEPEEQVVPKKKTGFKIPVPITSRPVLENITPRPTRSKLKVLVTQPTEDLDVAVTPHLDKTKVEFFTPQDSTPDQFFTPQTSVKTYSKKTLRQNLVKNLEQEFSTKENSKTKEAKPNDSLTKTEEGSANENKPNNTYEPSKLLVNEKPNISIERSKLSAKENPKAKNSNDPSKFSAKENKPNNSRNPSTLEGAKGILGPKRRVETGSLKALQDRRLKRSTSPGKLPKEGKPKPRVLRQPAIHVDKDDRK